MLNEFDCFWKIPLVKTREDSIVRVGSLCSATEHILSFSKFWTISFPQKPESLYKWLDRPRQKNHDALSIA